MDFLILGAWTGAILDDFEDAIKSECSYWHDFVRYKEEEWRGQKKKEKGKRKMEKGEERKISKLKNWEEEIYNG